ncbi:hypothetical protein EIN_155480 [Entamoeba invadens IP1]|uniref:Uncharacterized protein n=1 Tax=Entamoeba invadens IP1 TaxID=370355 RepID=A0A0A1UF63_ENTIV|nr:hypothetical protein EIN_155480 [Entamoeba invadens IP1]ELP91441.1 hypothetical protein EIN_155480 [Entamoeba invadens IP1]|eukprot:XP_004258212.1 hypothetical protein EIN_155480 [Entamoeba invadens IP1]
MQEDLKRRKTQYIKEAQSAAEKYIEEPRHQRPKKGSKKQLDFDVENEMEDDNTVIGEMNRETPVDEDMTTNSEHNNCSEMEDEKIEGEIMMECSDNIRQTIEKEVYEKSKAPNGDYIVIAKEMKSEICSKTGTTGKKMIT